MRIHNFLKSNKDRFPLKDVFVFNDIRITHLKLYEEVRSISYGLEKLGLKKDNKVSIILNNSLEFIYTVLAIANIGAVAVPLNISLSEDSSSGKLEKLSTSHRKIRSSHRLELSSVISSYASIYVSGLLPSQVRAEASVCARAAL